MMLLLVPLLLALAPAAFALGGDMSQPGTGVGSATSYSTVTISHGYGGHPTSGTGEYGALSLQNGNVVWDFRLNNASFTSGWLQVTNKADRNVNYVMQLNPNGGNVGVGLGTTEPGEKLHVNGNVRCQGSNCGFFGYSANGSVQYGACRAVTANNAVLTGSVTGDWVCYVAGGAESLLLGNVGDDKINLKIDADGNVILMRHTQSFRMNNSINNAVIMAVVDSGNDLILGQDFSNVNGIVLGTAGSFKTYPNSTGIVINENGDDRDLRVEGDGATHALFVDASADNVGINSSAPNAKLEVKSGGSDTNVLRVEMQDGSVGVVAREEADGGGGLYVYNLDESGFSAIDNNGIRAKRPGGETISAGGTITANACGGIKSISAAGAVTTDTTNTFTAPATANGNCIMYVCNTGANDITLDNNSNFIAGADQTLTANDCITVGSTGNTGVWYALTPIKAN
jgi:hypothetical protein